MIKEYFNIVLHSPMGDRKGFLTLFIDNEKLSGVFRLLGFDNKIESGYIKDGGYSFISKLKTAVGELNCKVAAHLEKQTLLGTANTEKEIIKITGILTQRNNTTW